MGMMVGGSNTKNRVIQIKNLDGSVAGTISVSKSAPKKKKRLNYNFKSISSQILLSKTSNSAGKAVTKARGTIAMLLRKVRSGDYDDQDLEHAIIHARKMERIAKKRMRHLKQEEEIEQKGKSAEFEDEVLEGLEESSEDEAVLELSEEELQRLMEEYEELMQESMEEMMQESMQELLEEASLEELSEEFCGAVYEMEPEDLEQLKKKHRSDEMREIMDADMKYLRAVFQKLEKERQALSSGIKNFAAEIPSGVSLEISGLEMPVEVQPVPVETAGASIDVMA
ncbi:MAG: hypothetical protein HFH33_06945 [Eubacterium sp.]|nr:hypothetical protein [Eubacterium sp.]